MKYLEKPIPHASYFCNIPAARLTDGRVVYFSNLTIGAYHFLKRYAPETALHSSCDSRVGVHDLQLICVEGNDFIHPSPIPGYLLPS